MGEISSAIAESIKNRATSTTLVTYTVFWALWHWQGLYVALFVGEDLILGKHELLKNEYLAQYFFGWHGWQTVVGYIAPVIFTVLFIWPLHKLLLIMYGIEQKNKTARRRVRLVANNEIEKLKAELAEKYVRMTQAEAAKVDAEAVKVEAEAKLAQSTRRAAKIDPEIAWSKDYEAFQKGKHYKAFKRIQEAIYEHNGRIKVYGGYNGGETFSVGVELLAFTDTEGLVSIDQKNKTIALTEKGRYFIKRYQQEQ